MAFAKWVSSGFYEITMSWISLKRAAWIFYAKVSVISFVFWRNLIGIIVLRFREWLVAALRKIIVFCFIFWNWIGYIALNLSGWLINIFRKSIFVRLISRNRINLFTLGLIRWLIFIWTLRKKKSTSIIQTRVLIRYTHIMFHQKLIIIDFHSIHNLIKKNKVINTFFFDILN